MAETLANKEKTSQIALRNLFCLCLFDKKLTDLFGFIFMCKNEQFMKAEGCEMIPNMVNEGLSVVNGSYNYVNEIDYLQVND